MGAAWLEGDVKDGPTRAVPPPPGIADRIHLGVWLTRASMPSLTQAFPGPHNHRSNHRIRRCRPISLVCERQGSIHPSDVFG